MALRQKPQPQILRHIGVLVFIDQNIAKPALVLRQHIGVGLKDRHTVHQQIAKVAGVQG